MTAIVNNAVANSCATDLHTALNAGSGAATIKFYTGTKPAGPDTAITSQTLLGTLTCSDPAGSVSGRVLTFGAITNDTAADADGTAAWARLLDSDGVAVLDVSVGLSGSGADIIMNNTTFVSGVGPISITSLTVTY